MLKWYKMNECMNEFMNVYEWYVKRGKVCADYWVSDDFTFVIK